jgi:NAD(P)H-hydrate epimerase
VRLVTREEMLEIDRRSTAEYHLPSLILMENAGRSVADWIIRHRPEAFRICILVGGGNNGGDGLVAARHLIRLGRSVVILLAVPPERLQGDASANLQAAEAIPVPVVPAWDPAHHQGCAAELAASSLVLDTLFGTGLAGPVRDGRADLIRLANTSGREIISVDLPSGLTCGGEGDPLIRASVTLTIGLPKTGMPDPAGRSACGRVVVLDIGFPPQLTGSVERQWLDAAAAAALLPRRPAASHKGSHGRLLVLAGSQAFPGAALLAARAALQAGPGLVDLVVPEGAGILPGAADPDLIGSRVAGGSDGAFSPDDLETLSASLEAATAVLMGPGLGRSADTGNFVKELIAACRVPLVLDADALYHLARQPVGFPCPAILTPHPGELSRLQAVFPEQGTIAALAARWGATVIAKNDGTLVQDPHGPSAWVTSGHPAMARGGSGDVLAGLLGGLLARGMPTFDASCLAVCLHGLAGRLAAGRYGADGVSASRLSAHLPRAFRSLAAGKAVFNPEREG